MVRIAHLSILVAITGLISACGEESATTEFVQLPPQTRDMNDQTGAAGASECGTFEQPGQYAVGIRSIDVDGVPVSIWYPADAAATAGLSKATYDIRQWLPAATASQIPDAEAPLMEMDAYWDLPVANGAFPIVLFSHGLGGYRMQSSFLMTHLASWGMVVAAPEHPERNLGTVLETGTIAGDNAPQSLRSAIAALRVENTSGGPFTGRLDVNRIAVSGHSMGTAATAQVAGDVGVAAWVALAGAGFGTGPAKPLLLMAGTGDDVAQIGPVRTGFDEQVAEPRRFVSITRAGHLAFTDICLIGQDRGGVIAIAREYGLEVPDALVQIATDGCQIDELPAVEAFPVINHYVVSHLRAAFGIDVNTLAFGPAAQRCLGAVVNEVVNINTPGAGVPSPQTPAVPGTPDAGVSAPPASPDQGTQQPTPADPDMGVSPPPAAPDMGAVQDNDPGAGIVHCRGTSGEGPMCSMSNTICCVGLSAEGECVAADACGAFQAPATCDGPEDCSNGQICCAGFPNGKTCKDECGQSAFGPEQEICNDDNDCGADRVCRFCQPPGGPASQLCTDGGCPSGYTEI